ncbi:hypothetical protein BDP81DRAFT_174180 [Colletotrichum phormii]|uniref:Uncharacterized protein n=1 Tax=Colletotrichum phormii TaxID=359342 RepID=A0AAJ0E9B3_9PEZI|nr:uncharacterized protein BDP81DRAFT_174180 [Colletotrichum phormii]KAK1621588.1 hypothetical protein BDP81DRAFT_174180 [Colletotrichum phormii]
MQHFGDQPTRDPIVLVLLLVRASRASHKYRAKVNLERRSRLRRAFCRRSLAHKIRVAQLCNQTLPCRYPGAREREAERERESGKYLRVMDQGGPDTTCMFRRRGLTDKCHLPIAHPCHHSSADCSDVLSPTS